MAGAGTSFNWVRVSSGVWTRIWQGPLIAGVPFEALELGTTGISGTSITWTLDGYSASPPFYARNAGSTVPRAVGPAPVGNTGSFAAVLSYAFSPWVEFWILTNGSCFAHIALF